MRLLAVLVFVALFAAGCSAGEEEPGTKTGAAVAAGESTPLPTVPQIVRKVQPSVVAVITEKGEGSGVIWDEQGLIVTNTHVVRNARRVQVLLASGRRIDAQVRATDPVSDLALVEVRERLPAAQFAKKPAEVGEFAVALGNPFGFERSVSAGIVSGVHRVLPAGRGSPPLVDLLQTDAAISPGNSGGALVNASGEVIGVNVAYIPPQAGAVEVGFAIPADTVRRVVRDLVEDGEAEHAFLGVQPTELWPELVDRLRIDVEAGVIVVSVTPGSPADEAGIRRGDIITSVDGNETRTVAGFLTTLADRSPGERVSLSVVRDGREGEATAVLSDRPG